MVRGRGACAFCKAPWKTGGRRGGLEEVAMPAWASSDPLGSGQRNQMRNAEG